MAGRTWQLPFLNLLHLAKFFPARPTQLGYVRLSLIDWLVVGSEASSNGYPYRPLKGEPRSYHKSPNKMVEHTIHISARPEITPSRPPGAADDFTDEMADWIMSPGAPSIKEAAADTLWRYHFFCGQSHVFGCNSTCDTVSYDIACHKINISQATQE